MGFLVHVVRIGRYGHRQACEHSDKQAQGELVSEQLLHRRKVHRYPPLRVVPVSLEDRCKASAKNNPGLVRVS